MEARHAGEVVVVEGPLRRWERGPERFTHREVVEVTDGREQTWSNRGGTEHRTEALGEFGESGVLDAAVAYLFGRCCYSCDLTSVATVEASRE